MRKIQNLILILSVIVILGSCKASTSISTSVSCTGYMLVEGSRNKETLAKTREDRVKGKVKPYSRRNKG